MYWIRPSVTHFKAELTVYLKAKTLSLNFDTWHAIQIHDKHNERNNLFHFSLQNLFVHFS